MLLFVREINLYFISTFFFNLSSCRRSLDTNTRPVYTNGFNGVTNPIRETTMNDVKFDFSDSGSHIYDDPELLMSNRTQKESYDTLNFSNKSFEFSEKPIYDSADGVVSTKPPSHTATGYQVTPHAGHVIPNPRHVMPSASPVPLLPNTAYHALPLPPSSTTSASSLKPPLVSPHYSVPRPCMPLNGKAKTVENDYQELNNSTCDSEAAPAMATARKNYVPHLEIPGSSDDRLTREPSTLSDMNTDDEQYMDMNSLT